MKAIRFDWRRAMASRLAAPPTRGGREVARALANELRATAPAIGRAPRRALALAAALGLLSVAMLLVSRLEPRPVAAAAAPATRTVALALASGTRLYVVIDERSRP